MGSIRRPIYLSSVKALEHKNFRLVMPEAFAFPSTFINISKILCVRFLGKISK